MEKDKNYLAVGIFVLLTAFAAAAFAIWMVGPHDKSKYTLYRIRFNESVSGLNIGGAVKFRGVDVGKVESIAIDPADTKRIRVDVEILKGTPVKTDTVASLKLAGVTGVVFVELSGSSPQAPNLAKTGDTDEGHIPEIHAESSSIDAIVNALPDILKKVSVISDQVGKLFSDENLGALRDTMQNFSQVSAALKAQTGAVEALLHNSNQVAQDLHTVIENSRGDIHSVAENLNQTSQKLNALIAHTNDTAGGQYQQFYQLVNEMKTAARDIDQLARSLKEEPSRILVPAAQKGIPAP